VLGGWLFYEALRSRESAARDARCMLTSGLRLLHDAVHGTRARLARDANGVVRIRRAFEFDFSEMPTAAASASSCSQRNVEPSTQPYSFDQGGTDRC
jgi:hypothetical protein